MNEKQRRTLRTGDGARLDVGIFVCVYLVHIPWLETHIESMRLICTYLESGGPAPAALSPTIVNVTGDR